MLFFASLGSDLSSRLTDRERETLTGRLREQAESAGIELNLRVGQSSAAAADVTQETARRSGGGAGQRDPRLLEQHVRALFADAQFEAARSPALSLVRAFTEGRLSDETLRQANQGRFWETGRPD